MKKIITIAIFIICSTISFSQSTKDSLSELQSLLDSIPDISLAELGIDTTAEIVPDTLHLVIPASIASDTTYARTCLLQSKNLINIAKFIEAYSKADTAKHIYQIVLGYISRETSECLHQMSRALLFRKSYNSAKKLSLKNARLRLTLYRSFSSELASTINLLAGAHELLREDKMAIICYHKSLSIRKIIIGQDSLDLAASLNNIGRVFHNIGEYSKSILYKKYALNIRLNKFGEKDDSVIAGYNNISKSYSAMGNYYDAISYLKHNLLIINLQNRIDKSLLADIHLGIGNNYENLGYFDKAIEEKKNSLEIYLELFGEKDLNVATSFNNLGNSYISFGKYHNGLDYLFKSLAIRLEMLGSYHIDVADTYLNIANAYYYLLNFEKGIAYLNYALEIQKKMLESTHPDLADTYNNLGLFNRAKGNNQIALSYLEKALEIRMSKLGDNHPIVGETYNNIGMILQSNLEFQKALKFKQKALEIKLETYKPDNPIIASSYNNIGNTYFSMGEYNLAISNYKKAIEINQNNTAKIHPDLLISKYKIASTFQRNNQLDSSLFYLHQAISGFKAHLSSDISAETKNIYQSQNLPVFESAIDISLIKSKQDQHDSLKIKTFEYTELAKASLLQSQIKQTDALAFAGIPDSLLQKEYDLRIDINWREKQRQALLEKGKEETDQDVLRISSIIFDLKREQETLFETLEKDYPEYYRLKYDTKTISLEDTQQKLLQKGQTMLEYFVGDSSVFIFVVRPDTFDVVQVKKDFALDSLVKQMQTGLYGYHGQSPDKRTDVLYKKSIIDYTNAANELYNRIVAPVSHLLTSDLVIIPDGVLGYVPFEPLLKSKPEKLNQFATYPYMINDHTISYNYSATLYQEMKNKKHKKEPTKSLVAFAPFYEGSFTVLDSTINLVFDTLPDGRDTTIFQDIVSRKIYAPLPGSGIEAATVSKLYQGDYFVNSDATEQKFYDVAGDYRMVHLSTHGVADARQGDYSYLAFAEQKDSIENEFLYVRDIYNTQLNADLVFLSACETAQGELQRGEGIISLARAFAYAGAKSIITTLWQVDDAATKDISIDFYKNLKKGFTKDVALRQAKLRHIKSAKSAQKHPFFWAAMIGIGDMGAVK